MNFLIDPNVSYLLLVSGLVIGILALLSPGTGILEIVAVFVLVLAGYGIYNLPVNLWALAIILFGVIAFFAALKTRSYVRWSSLVISALGLMVGSILLFQKVEGEAEIHPVFIIVTTILAEGLMYWVGSNILDATIQKPVHTTDRILNMIGTAYSDIYAEGTAYVDGEEWSARSETPIPAGSDVVVVNRDGLILTVKPVESDNH